jgi:hypothetical protein
LPDASLQTAIVSQQQQSFAVEVEPTGRINPLGIDEVL